jgi:hypothetical protein
MLLGELEGDHVAYVVGDEVDLINPEDREHTRDIPRLGLLVEAAGRFRGQV